MRALSDKWNFRVWFRDWLNAPSRMEKERAAAAKAKSDAAWAAFFAENDVVKARRVAENAQLAPEREASATSFSALSLAGDSLVLRVAFGNPACREVEFWAPLTSTSHGIESTLGWIKFKRGMAFMSTVLFEATEVRAACSAALPPEPSLRASIALLQEGT